MRQLAYVVVRSNGQGQCVEVGSNDQILIRDTKLGEASPVLFVLPINWQLFVDHVRTGGVLSGFPTVEFAGGEIRMRTDSSGPVLSYSPAEWDAFVAGVELGEFDLDQEGKLPALAL
ncbi:DUF397 domain-containing protein [Fodinicola feengrottensis]|uniref:DUF397 domain-containing protein n=1 Tax=Fodinicola feengrottensis TaxID=435914 RepID=UPI00244354D0|nr:DUF397 domain-containing protein [Fodinicola feengrottensis]